jgi:ABC-2 type transport system ATP-binding protein
MAIAIDVASVSKRFVLNPDARSLKERVVRRGKIPAQEFWALRDVSLQVAQGETLGLLGHNGSGKSTLLKLVGGIMKPTQGEIRVRGRLASLLELGAGFHPELTGRENIFINGAILGLSRRDLAKRFDEIVEFAELERFIDMQVRSYSSGMYVRLGFAVAVNVDPDVLLVDEVLAVGDENFQRKCIDRVHQFQREGRTIVVVSHSVDQLRKICNQVAVLDHGHLVTEGPPGEAIRVFREHLLRDQLDRTAMLEARAQQGEGADGLEAAAPSPEPEAPTVSHGAAQEAKRNLKVRIAGITLEHPHLGERSYLLPGEGLSVRVAYVATERVSDVVFGININDHRDGKELFGINTDLLGIEVPPLEGSGAVTFRFESVPLLDGTYPITVGIHSHDEGVVYDWSEQRTWFEVMNPDRRVGTVAMPVSATLDTDLSPTTAATPSR